MSSVDDCPWIAEADRGSSAYSVESHAKPQLARIAAAKPWPRIAATADRHALSPAVGIAWPRVIGSGEKFRLIRYQSPAGHTIGEPRAIHPMDEEEPPADAVFLEFRIPRGVFSGRPGHARPAARTDPPPRILSQVLWALQLVRDIDSTPFEPLVPGAEEVVSRSCILPLRHRTTGIRVNVAIGMSGFEQQAVRQRKSITPPSKSFLLLGPRGTGNPPGSSRPFRGP